MDTFDLSIQFEKAIRKFEENKHKIHIHLILNRQATVCDTPSAEKVALFLRGLSDEKAADLISRFESNGLGLTTYDGDLDFIRQQINGNNNPSNKLNLLYQAGVSMGGPAHRALIPTFCSHYQIHSMNSDAASRTVIWHKLFHGKLLESSNLSVPKTFLYDSQKGWHLNMSPPIGLKVIAKSTYEAYAVGVDDNSVFHYNPEHDSYLREKSLQLGQPVTIQEFISGNEVYIPVLELDSPVSLFPQQLKIDNDLVCGDRILQFQQNVAKKYSFESYHNSNYQFIERLRVIAQEAFTALQQSVISRVDVRITNEGNVYIIDQAEVPSLSRDHAVNQAFRHCGGHDNQLIPVLIGLNLMKIRSD